ncbi:hypothetical protein [Pantoea sp. AS142]|uniref:hypothetical protein n=1 Tax=Pantoea sp. AS142 TaxID=3081292 RepID=UPI003FA70748
MPRSRMRTGPPCTYRVVPDEPEICEEMFYRSMEEWQPIRLTCPSFIYFPHTFATATRLTSAPCSTPSRSQQS